ncbi:family 16 glycosylhydrolase [Azospirillum agricola]|uniref:family 16 glycosylhydrolase n=1 Tax=Azospirillum agricola TaxID=1720247 RepID=UPI000A0F0F11|nr:family 16 glycosylhydrolase [Azospirillum agricola]SMH44926.1 Beta-glucanase, GH16 family [Azospirillum lipoferum]
MRVRRQAAMVAMGVGLAAALASQTARAETAFSRQGGSFEERFATFDSTRWQKSNGWSNGSYMGCGWNEGNLAIQKGKLTLSVTNQPSGREAMSCAEYRTHRFYGPGTYSVNLKAVKAEGVMTSVSHYTGPPFGDPWDEITMGIAGKDTTKLEISYVANGVGHRDTVIDLGFDAAKEFHTYGFEWKPDRIVWTVDGKAVHTATGKPDELPRLPGRLYLQFWNGAGDTAWLHRFQYPGKPLTAEIAWVRFREDSSTLNN